MKSISSGKTKGSHPQRNKKRKKKKINKKKKYTIFLKRFKKRYDFGDIIINSFKITKKTFVWSYIENP